MFACALFLMRAYNNTGVLRAVCLEPCQGYPSGQCTLR